MKLKKRAGLYLLLAAASLCSSGCEKEAAPASQLSVVISGMDKAEAGSVMEKLSSSMDIPVTWEFKEEKDGMNGVREGLYQCGLSGVDGMEPLHYGLLKSAAVSREILLVLSEKNCADFTELTGKNVGCPASLNDGDLEFLKGVTEERLHIYETEDQMMEDLESGMLEAAVISSLETKELIDNRLWKGMVSQPAGGPVTEYRFYTSSQEILDRVIGAWKE